MLDMPDPEEPPSGFLWWSMVILLALTPGAALIAFAYVAVMMVRGG